MYTHKRLSAKLCTYVYKHVRMYVHICSCVYIMMVCNCQQQQPYEPYELHGFVVGS